MRRELSHKQREDTHILEKGALLHVRIGVSHLRGGRDLGLIPRNPCYVGSIIWYLWCFQEKVINVIISDFLMKFIQTVIDALDLGPSKHRLACLINIILKQ